MDAKLYAVKVGRKPGVYSSWSECEEQVKGFPGAIFKSFTDRNLAESFCSSAAEKLVSKASAANKRLQVFVDGSFRNGRYSWAFVVYQGDKEIYCDYGVGENDAANSMRNVAGELAATMRAARWLAMNKYEAVIHHDYQGISSWVTGDWKTKNEHTQRYAAFMKPMYGLGIFTFNKVAGHTGIAGNERADELCALAFKKEAIA